MRPVRRAYKSAVEIVPNVKVGMEAQHSTLLLSLQDLLGKALLFFMFISYLVEAGSLNNVRINVSSI